MVYVYFDRLSSEVAMNKLKKSLEELNVKYKMEFIPPREIEAGSYKHIFIDFGGIHDAYTKTGRNYHLFLHRTGRFIRMIEDNPGTVFVILSEVVWTYMSKEMPELDTFPNVIKSPWLVKTEDVAEILHLEYKTG